VTVIWSGIGVGAIYALIAIEYNIVFIATGVFNFAQAQLAVSGTFLAYFLGTTAHLPAFAIVLLSAVGGAGLAVVEEMVAVRPLQGRGAHGELVTTLGAAVVLEGAALILWGSQPLQVHFPGPQGVLTIFGGRVLPVSIGLVACSIFVVICLRFIMRRTMIGLACLATAENRPAAMLRGINVRVVSLLFFAFAGALAGATGVLVGPVTFAVYDGGNSLALMGFLALAIGGFGSQGGALLGGMAVGLVQAVSSRYLSAAYSDIVLFGMLLALLLTRPQGLFGRAAQRVV
jgi:branched-chain amino acid transport system permease protein